MANAEFAPVAYVGYAIPTDPPEGFTVRGVRLDQMRAGPEEVLAAISAGEDVSAHVWRTSTVLALAIDPSGAYRNAVTEAMRKAGK